MSTQSLRENFYTSKEELTKLGLEFNSEALPLLEKLHDTTSWILSNKRAAKKIITRTFYEAIENCDITKDYSDWYSWIHRIWMRKILEHYSDKENDKQTIFDFIDHEEVKLKEVKDFFRHRISGRELIKSLEKLPSVLLIPMILKEAHSLNYEKIAKLIDVPDGVVATRIYRARKLLYLFLRNNFNNDEKKKMGVPEGSAKLIFELRRCALLIDDEFTADQKSIFNESVIESSLYNSEILIQREIKKLFENLSPNFMVTARIKAKIERKARKRFG